MPQTVQKGANLIVLHGGEVTKELLQPRLDKDGKLKVPVQVMQEKYTAGSPHPDEKKVASQAGIASHTSTSSDKILEKGGTISLEPAHGNPHQASVSGISSEDYIDCFEKAGQAHDHNVK